MSLKGHISEESALRSLRDIVERESGIQIGEQKIELLKNRIRKRLRALHLNSEAQYLEVIQSDVGGEELVHLLDVISTNHTFFWRENQHFPFYKEIVEKFAVHKKSEVKTWCAASSSGEEPYTLSILNEEVEKQFQCSTKILATDISIQILQKAVEAEYPLAAVQALPPTYQEYFLLNATEGSAVACPSIRNRITFKQLNLSKFPYPLKGDIDIIFCRNVMIYFETALKQKIINQFEQLLSPGGYLFISHSENLLGVTHNLKSVSVGVYRKAGGAW